MRLSPMLRTASSPDVKNPNRQPKKRWKPWWKKHCAELDDRVISLAVGFHAGDDSATANKLGRGFGN